MGRSPVEGEVDGGAVAVFEDLGGFFNILFSSFNFLFWELKIKSNHKCQIVFTLFTTY